LRGKSKAPARICNLRQASGRGYAEARFPRRCRSENGTIRCTHGRHSSCARSGISGRYARSP
jgi:hypothetical protein